jgi:hypothetical protein
MSFSTPALNAWFNEADNRLGFVKKAILGGDTAAVVKKAPGIKYKLPLNGLYTTSTFVADSCDDSASGTTTFTQRVLEVKPLKDVELICAADLQTKWTNALMASGSPDTVPAEIATLIMDEKARAHQGALETAVWQETSLFSGFNKILEDLGFGGAGDPINGNPTGITAATGIVASNIMTIMDNMYSLIPAAVKSQHKDELVCFMGYDVYSVYSLKLRDLNLFHYKPTDGLGELYHPGTNMRVVPVGGQNGTYRMVSTWKDNLIIGCDVDSEETNVRWIDINDKDYEGVKVKTNIKIGVQIALTEDCVYFDLVP